MLFYLSLCSLVVGFRLILLKHLRVELEVFALHRSEQLLVKRPGGWLLHRHIAGPSVSDGVIKLNIELLRELG